MTSNTESSAASEEPSRLDAPSPQELPSSSAPSSSAPSSSVQAPSVQAPVVAVPVPGGEPVGEPAVGLQKPDAVAQAPTQVQAVRRPASAPVGPPDILGTPLSPTATRVMVLGAGELGKELVIAFQRLGVEVVAAVSYTHLTLPTM